MDPDTVVDGATPEFTDEVVELLPGLEGGMGGSEGCFELPDSPVVVEN